MMMNRITKEEMERIKKELRQMEEVEEEQRQREEKKEQLHSEVKRMTDEYEKWVMEIVDSDRARSLTSAYQRGAFDVLKLLGYE